MIITAYNEVIPNAVVEGQRKVLEKFGEKIIQIKPKVWGGHAHTIDEYLRNNDWDHAIVLDIDCIPLEKNVIKDARECASPAFIAFSRKTYEELGKPSFQGSSQWDVGGEFSYRASEKNLSIKLMYPNHVENPKWKFADGSMFGIGTTYENKVYHHFEGRRVTKSFEDKCNQILLK